MMELGALIVFLAVFAGCGVVVFAVSFFGVSIIPLKIVDIDVAHELNPFPLLYSTDKFNHPSFLKLFENTGKLEGVVGVSFFYHLLLRLA